MTSSRLLTKTSMLCMTAASLVTLSGCQHIMKAPTAPVVKMPTSAAQPPKPVLQFTVMGKIGVKTPKQNGSAFYAWTQVDNRFAIDLTGALGIGQTHIEGIPGQVTLRSARTGLLTATTPEELLQQATGWQAPISYLPYWIQAKSAQVNNTAKFDSLKRLSQLNEGGWQVQFNYLDTQPLPQKLIMSQVVAGGENRVILTVQNRGDAVQP